MPLNGQATVQGVTTLHGKQLGDGLFTLGLRLLTAYRDDQAGRLSDYEAFARELNSDAGQLVALCGRLSALDSVRGSAE